MWYRDVLMTIMTVDGYNALRAFQQWLATLKFYK